MEDGKTRAMLVRELVALQRNVNAYGKMIGERIGKDNLDHIRRLMWLFDGVKEGS